jgi:hypothetical protein
VALSALGVAPLDPFLLLTGVVKLPFNIKIGPETCKMSAAGGSGHAALREDAAFDPEQTLARGTMDDSSAPITVVEPLIACA